MWDKFFHSSWLLFFLLVGFSSLEAQPSSDLWKDLQNSDLDTSKVKILLAVGRSYRRYDLDSCFYYHRQAVQLADQLNDHHWRISSRLGLGGVENDDGSLQKGLDYMLEALRIAQKHQVNYQLGYIYNYLGIGYRDLAVPDSSFYYHTLSEKAFIETNELHQLWRPNNGLARLFHDTKDFEKAFIYAEKAYLSIHDPSNRIARGVCIYWMALSSFEAYDLVSYVKSVNLWHDFIAEKPHNTALDSPQHSNLIVFDLKAPNIEERLKESIIIAVAQKNPMSILVQYKSLGMHYKAVGKISEAIDAYEKGMLVAKQMKLSYSVYDFAQVLYQLNKQLGNPEALPYLEQYSELRDSLQNAERMRSLNELEVKYETEKKNEQIQLRTKERNYLIISSALLGLLLFISILFFRNRLFSNRKLAEKESALQAQKITQLEQEKQLLRYSAMIDGQEMERRRIAKDLHDSIGGSLSAAKSHLTALSEKFVVLKHDGLFNKTNAILNNTFDDVRRISLNLMPRVLELMGLQEAIEDLGDHLNQNDIACKVEIVNMQQEPPKTIAVNIYRIIQELTNNIFKHAQAKQVLIQLLFEQDHLEILVEDNGIGFDYATASQSSQLGLNSLQSRVNFLKGSIEFDSIAGEGTAVFVHIPLSLD